MYEIPKFVPLMIGAWGIAQVEGVAVNTVRVRFKRGKLPAVDIAGIDDLGERRLRVPGVALVEKWGGGVEAHNARLLDLAEEESISAEEAAMELSMKVWDLRSHVGQIVNEDGTVDTNALFSLAGIMRTEFLRSRNLSLGSRNLIWPLYLRDRSPALAVA
ncbi:hypothetical protein ACVH9Z_34270 [Rhodococcus opacus]|uniref:hypothetical protein n=1 Tax=Rhodococcus opacus TaxID=37919 RepID=UPI001B3148B1|nr:hypothetical protein [Rhodococcus opacus]